MKQTEGVTQQERSALLDNVTLTRIVWTKQNVWTFIDTAVQCIGEDCHNEAEYILKARPGGWVTELNLPVCAECSETPHKILAESLGRKDGA